ncbi:hypothetical protein [Actinoplanes sp. NPDC026670]|uniref:hypothetical protein n=1 Tax=Actinoplanes sp. NPDC026670 TaxID=3154700 RepID=UPI003402DA0C
MFSEIRRVVVGLVAAGALVGVAAVPAAAATSVEFIGYGRGRSATISINKARTSAFNQAAAAGYSASQCVTVLEDAEEETRDTFPVGTWIGEVDIICTR